MDSKHVVLGHAKISVLFDGALTIIPNKNNFRKIWLHFTFLIIQCIFSNNLFDYFVFLCSRQVGFA